MITLSSPLPRRYARQGKSLGEVFDRSRGTLLQRILHTEQTCIRAFGTHPTNLITYHALPTVATLPGRAIKVTTPCFINALRLRIGVVDSAFAQYFYLLTPSGFVRAAWAGSGERLVLLYSEYETIASTLSQSQLSKLYLCGAITDRIARQYLFKES